MCVCCDGICVISAEGESGETAIGHSQHLIESAKWNNYSISEVSYPSERCICSCSFQFQCIQLLWIVPLSAGVGIWSHRKLPIVHRTTFVGSLSGGG